VHALYDFLLDLRNVYTPNQGIDLPRLIATTVFPHASLKRAQITYNTQVSPSCHFNIMCRPCGS